MAHFACIGVGNVGSAWAVVFSQAGHSVAMYDAVEGEAENRALERARSTLELIRDAGRLHEDIDTILARIQPVSTLEDAVQSASYVQESVREDVSIKRDLFSKIAEIAPQDCILASSTSAIKGSAFLEHIANPERALVAHPVNPPSLIPLVELCPTEWTSASVVEKARSFLTHVGMQPITVRKEIDGFILNRLQYTLVAEAMHLVGEGYCSASDVDRVITQGLALRWATIGPFQVAHLNASEGFQGFVDQLGPMMKRMGKMAVTDYDWGDSLVAEIHAELTKDTPVETIPEMQNKRNRGILAVKDMQHALTETDE